MPFFSDTTKHMKVHNLFFGKQPYLMLKLNKGSQEIVFFFLILPNTRKRKKLSSHKGFPSKQMETKYDLVDIIGSPLSYTALKVKTIFLTRVGLLWKLFLQLLG